MWGYEYTILATYRAAACMDQCVCCDEHLGMGLLKCWHEHLTFDLLSPPQAKEEYQKVMMQLMEERQQHQVAIAEYKQVGRYHGFSSLFHVNHVYYGSVGEFGSKMMSRWYVAVPGGNQTLFCCVFTKFEAL